MTKSRNVITRIRKWISNNPTPTAAVSAAIIGIYVLARAWGSPDFYPIAVPGVLTGAGTLALAAVTYQVLRGDQQDRRERETRERRDQASRVHPGIPHLEPVIVGATAYGNLYHYEWKVEIHNRSEWPLRNVTIYAHLADGLIEHTRTSIVAAPEKQLATAHTPQITADNWTTIAITTARWEPDEAGPQRNAREALIKSYPPDIAISFTDKDGTRWLRDQNWNLADVTGWTPQEETRFVLVLIQHPDFLQKHPQ